MRKMRSYLLAFVFLAIILAAPMAGATIFDDIFSFFAIVASSVSNAIGFGYQVTTAQFAEPCDAYGNCPPDGNPCTDDGCVGGLCTYPNLPNNTGCGGSNVCCSGSCTTPTCTSNAQCPTGWTCLNPGTCTSSCVQCTINSQCDDSNPCTTDTCVANVCQHSNVPNNTTCPSGVCCTGNCIAPLCSAHADCQSGWFCLNPGTCTSLCVECITNANCDDSNPCTTDTCVANTCQNSNVANNTPCAGGVCCTGTCTAPVCSSNADCLPGQTCLNPGTCTAQCSGVACTHANPSISITPTSQSAIAGTALAYTANVTNNDGSSCTSRTFTIDPTSCPAGWTCSTPADLTLNPAASNTASISVTSSATAVQSTYTFTYKAQNTTETAYQASNSASYVVVQCTASSQCNDANSCTTDSCVANVCQHAPVVACSMTSDGCCPSGCTYLNDSDCLQCTTNGECNDSNPCTTDTCVANVCQHAPVTNCSMTSDGCCPSGCTYLNDSDCVQCTINSQCDDSNPCTTDTCVANTCQNSNVANNTPCAGGVCCTGTCTAPVCSSNADCGALQICQNAGTCTAQCVSVGCIQNSDCDDSNPCTTDTCVANVCQHSNVPNNTTCPSGVCCSGLCNAPECASSSDCQPGQTCENAGTCTAACAGSYCGDGTCDTPVESCSNCIADCGCQAGYTCADGTCEQTICTPGETRTCTTPDGCTNGKQTCNQWGTGWSACACEAGYTCTGGTCQAIDCTTNADCDDSNPCTTDTCTGGACTYANVPSGTSCSGGICCSGSCMAPECYSSENCQPGQTCSTPGTCSAVCLGTYCGDTICQAGESCSNCLDCRCGSGLICCGGACSTAACTSDESCAEGETCENAGSCNAQCVTSTTDGDGEDGGGGGGGGGGGRPLKLAYNDANLVGDTLVVQVLRTAGNTPVADANVWLTFPSGVVETKLTDENGAADFILKENGGEHLVKAEKQGLGGIEDDYRVTKIIVEFEENFTERVQVGTEVPSRIITEFGEPVRDVNAVVVTPAKETPELEIDENGNSSFRVTDAGNYELRLSRKNINFFAMTIVGLGMIEVVSGILSQILEIIFGPILRIAPHLALLLLILAIIAASIVFNRSKMFFEEKIASSRIKKQQLLIRIDLAILFFALPLLLNRFINNTVGIATALVEIIVVLVFSYFVQTKGKGVKQVKIEGKPFQLKSIFEKLMPAKKAPPKAERKAFEPFKPVEKLQDKPEKPGI